MITFQNPRLRQRSMYDDQDTTQEYVEFWDNVNGWTNRTLYPAGLISPGRRYEFIREEMFGRETKPPYTKVVSTEHYQGTMEWNPTPFWFPGGYGATPWVRSLTWAKNILHESYIAYDYPSPPSGFGNGITQQCLQSVSNGHPEKEAMQALPFVGELKESIEQIRNPASFLKELLRRAAYKRAKARFRRLTLRDLMVEQGMTATTGGFLGYQYGWKPLVQDLQKLATTFGRFRDDYDEYKRLKDGSQPPKTFKKWAFQSATSPIEERHVNGFFKRNGSHDHTAGCMLKGTYHPSAETMSKASFLRHKLGITPQSIVTAAWELTTLSFVVDWFIPVGDFLEGITALPVDYSVEQVQYTYTLKGVTTYTLDRLPLEPNGSLWPSTGIVCLTTFQDFYVKCGAPIFASEPSWSMNPNVLALFALIQQRLRGRIR